MTTDQAVQLQAASACQSSMLAAALEQLLTDYRRLRAAVPLYADNRAIEKAEATLANFKGCQP